MVSTVWSVSCLLFFYSRCPHSQPFVEVGTCPPCPAICKSGRHVPPCPMESAPLVTNIIVACALSCECQIRARNSSCWRNVSSNGDLKSAKVERVDSVVLVPENSRCGISNGDAVHHERVAFVGGRVGRLHFEPWLHCRPHTYKNQINQIKFTYTSHILSRTARTYTSLSVGFVGGTDAPSALYAFTIAWNFSLPFLMPLSFPCHSFGVWGVVSSPTARFGAGATAEIGALETYGHFSHSVMLHSAVYACHSMKKLHLRF